MTRYGVLLPTFDPLRIGGAPRVAAAAARAEQLGFDAVWAGDHLACPAPVLDAPSCLAAAAAVTERVSLGLSVMLVGLRQPAWVAKQLATIDALSHGRLQLGVGVGGEFPEEFEAVGARLSLRGPAPPGCASWPMRTGASGPGSRCCSGSTSTRIASARGATRIRIWSASTGWPSSRSSAGAPWVASNAWPSVWRRTGPRGCRSSC